MWLNGNCRDIVEVAHTRFAFEAPFYRCIPHGQSQEATVWGKKLFLTVSGDIVTAVVMVWQSYGVCSSSTHRMTCVTRLSGM